MKNLTEEYEIVRGGRWPPAEDYAEFTILNVGGWPVGADGWTWQLCLSRVLRGGTPDLTLDAEYADLTGNVITARFHATAAETAALPGAAAQTFYADIKSTNGAVVSYYDIVQCTARVRSAPGPG